MGAGRRILPCGPRRKVGSRLGHDRDRHPWAAGRAREIHMPRRFRRSGISIRALRAAGASLADVVRTRIYVIEHRRVGAEMGRAHGEFFRDVRPAATMVEVNRLIAPEMLVEIEADAVIRMSRRQRFTQVDAFTERALHRQSRRRVPAPRPAEPAWMQDVAREMNLAETAFLVRPRDGFDLRWFTPGREVDLCGHATLASAHVLWEEQQLQASEVARFHTRSGVLEREPEPGLIWLDFPANPERVGREAAELS